MPDPSDIVSHCSCSLLLLLCHFMAEVGVNTAELSSLCSLHLLVFLALKYHSFNISYIRKMLHSHWLNSSTPCLTNILCIRHKKSSSSLNIFSKPCNLKWQWKPNSTFHPTLLFAAAKYQSPALNYINYLNNTSSTLTPPFWFAIMTETTYLLPHSLKWLDCFGKKGILTHFNNLRADTKEHLSPNVYQLANWEVLKSAFYNGKCQGTLMSIATSPYLAFIGFFNTS